MADSANRPAPVTGAHLTRAGHWRTCQAEQGCTLAYHVPGMTPEAAANLPMDFLDVLLPQARLPNCSGPYNGVESEWWEDEEGGGLHRDYDLPALVQEDGTRQWHRRGKLHRDFDRPAVIDPGGAQRWYRHGKLHREHGPAVLGPDGSEEWLIDGERHRPDDLPALIRPDGTRQWWWHGKLHRDSDEPADIMNTGTLLWYDGGQLHREGPRPAVIYTNGSVVYYKLGRMMPPPGPAWRAEDYMDFHRDNPQFPISDDRIEA